MALKILSHIQTFNIDMQQKELQNAVVHPLASNPASPVAGQIYYNTGSGDLFYYNGLTSTWVSSAGVTSIVAGNGITVTGTNTVTVTNATVGYASTAKSASTVTLTATSASRQNFTGTATQALTLPAIATLYVGWSVTIINDAALGNINVSAAGPIGIGPVAGGQIARFVCTALTGAENEAWNVLYEGSYSATGSDMLVYSNGPVLTAPDLGTPTNVVLTSGTGLPIVAGTTGTLTVARGGTGVTTFTANGILYGNGGSALQVTAAGTQHQVLRAGGSGVPSFGAIDISQPSAVTGTLVIGNGGTGSTTGSITGSGALTFTAGGADNNVTLVPTGTGSVNVSSKKIINLAEPTLATDAATKGYVDSVAQGLDAKQSVRAATTANITLSAPQTIDGVAVIAGDRVLVKNQSTNTENGIYVAAAGAWTRSNDANTWDELVSAFTFVEEGTLNKDTGWVCTANAGGTLGGTAVLFTQFSAAGAYTASTGITLNVNDFQLAAGNVLSLHNLVNNGFVVRTATNTVTPRSITAATTSSGAGGGITVANGDGVAANPTISLKSFSAQGPSSAANTWTVTHNLDSEYLIVTLREAGGGKELVLADTIFTNNNSLQFSFATNQNANTLKVSILRVD
jgi:hypothetical protein